MPIIQWPSVWIMIVWALLGRKCRDWTAKLQVNTDALCTQQHIQIAVSVKQLGRWSSSYIAAILFLSSCIPVFTTYIYQYYQVETSSEQLCAREKESEWEPGTCLHLFMINQTNRSPWACCLQWTYFPEFDQVFTAFLSLVKRKYDSYCTDSTSELTSATLACYWHFNPVFFSLTSVFFTRLGARSKHVISSCPNWWPWQPAHPSRLTIIRFAHDPCRRKNSCLRLMGSVRSSVLSIRPNTLASSIHLFTYPINIIAQS